MRRNISDSLCWVGAVTTIVKNKITMLYNENVANKSERKVQRVKGRGKVEAKDNVLCSPVTGVVEFPLLRKDKTEEIDLEIQELGFGHVMCGMSVC